MIEFDVVAFEVAVIGSSSPSSSSTSPSPPTSGLASQERTPGNAGKIRRSRIASGFHFFTVVKIHMTGGYNPGGLQF